MYNVKKLFFALNRRYPKLLSCLDDKQDLKLLYRIQFGKELNLDMPITFNEKIQWLKLYDRNPTYTIMADKYLVKKYVASVIGDEYIIPTFGVWKHYDEIDFDSLPDQFVLKCTHDSGGIVICKDKSDLDKQAKRKIERSLRRDYYWAAREWSYKEVKPQVLAEKYVIDKKLQELRDYKFFCFNGKVRCFKVDFDRFENHRANYYDEKCNLIDLGEVVCPPDPKKQIEFPKSIYHMMHLAEILSANIPFIRVDFYDVDGHIFFGELTFYPNSGLGRFTDDKWDYILGSWISLPS